MKVLLAGMRKELRQLLADKTGLLLMFLMPVVLVFIISIVQDSTFKLVSENKLKVMVSNQDKGNQADSLISALKKSGSFDITRKNISPEQLRKNLLNTENLLGLYFPQDFSEKLERKAEGISGKMLSELGLGDSTIKTVKSETTEIELVYDPVLQENYRQSISAGVQSSLSIIENKLLINKLYAQLGYDKVPPGLDSMMLSNRTAVVQLPAGDSHKDLIPNSAQHNVPAWSIFAMFFMVISLGSNIVRERKSGTFVRILLSPASFYSALLSKMAVFILVALVQQVVIFSIGMFVFPLIGLPELQLPANIPALLAVSLLSGIAAVSYAVTVGTLANSVEQSNGFGAVSIVIFAAIGGIWVPVFVMPPYLQTIANISPLHWCLEGFYTLFLRNGNWHELVPVIVFLTCFSLFCQLITLVKLKKQKFL